MNRNTNFRAFASSHRFPVEQRLSHWRGLALAALFLCLAVIVAPAYAEKASAEVDYLEVATILVKDGRYQQALDALRQVNLDGEEVKQAHFYTLKGLVYLNLSQSAKAEEALRKALASGAQDKAIQLYLAQAHFQQQDYQETLNALERSRTGDRVPAVYTMAARSYWELGQWDKALATLRHASHVLIDESSFVHQRIFYLIDLGLYRKAAELGLEYLEESKASAHDYVAVGNALRQSRQFDQALKFLVTAAHKFPRNSKVKRVLARTYLDRGLQLAAAQVMTEAARLNPDLMPEAAELQRRAGNLYQALLLNAAVRDQTKKLKQRLAILLELKRYGQVAGMGDALYRVGLLRDEDMRYAYAYALFMTGELKAAADQLSGIQGGELFRKSVKLREAIKACKSEPWRCL